MRYRLLFQEAPATHALMRCFVTCLLLMFAVLLSSTHVSAFAHSHTTDAEYAVQTVDVDHHAVAASDDGDDKTPMKNDIDQHHHCSSILVIEPAIPCDAQLIQKSRVFPAPMTPMASLLSAPPTQPPSA